MQYTLRISFKGPLEFWQPSIILIRLPGDSEIQRVHISEASMDEASQALHPDSVTCHHRAQPCPRTGSPPPRGEQQ